MKKYFMFGLLICLFPIMAKASTKQITCEYSYPSMLGCDLQNVKFSFTVYDDKAEFDGFKNCSGGVKDGNCLSSSYSGAKIFLDRGLEDKFLNEAYNKTTKKYGCPDLSYRVFDTCALNVNYGKGVGESQYPLRVRKVEHVTGTSNSHKKICSYNQMVGGITGDISFTVYYEGPSMYSLTVFHAGQTYSTGPSNKDLVTTLSNKTLSVSKQTLDNLYSDFDPNKAYTKCNQKKLYFNDYNSYYTLEDKQGGFTDIPLEPDVGNNNGNGNWDTDGVADCQSLLGPTITGYLKTGLSIIQIAGVILAIILGMGDFIGSLLSGEADSNKKAFKKLMIRIAMAATLFIVPALLKFIIDTFGIADNGMCIL